MMSMIIENNQDNREGLEITRMLVSKCFRNRNILKKLLSMKITDLFCEIFTINFS
jgi:hypothetical protein